MAAANYIVRFDDVCPTMNWDVWNKVEAALMAEGIKPVLAVVPDNKDHHLMYDSYNDQFWWKVRQWQHLGWSIALHGYQHLYQSDNPGILGLNNYSEFAGLSYEEQKQKLQRAMKIFKKNGVAVDLWVAPAHSFDATTVRVLSELGVNVISDGFFRKPVSYLNVIWIPQQIWKFRQFRSGVWTVCFHVNAINEMELEKLLDDFKRFRGKIKSLNYIIDNVVIKPASTIDHVFAKLWLLLIKLKRLVNSFIK